MSKTELVYRVDTVDLTILKSNPPQLSIHSNGMTRTAGYRNPRLVEVIYVVPPADGIWEYSFEADPPTGPAAEVLTPISAHTVRLSIPPGLKGIRVKGATNAKESRIDLVAKAG